MQSAYHFFYANAGYSYNPATETRAQGHRRCAKALADAEKQIREAGISFSWEPDHFIDSSEFSDDPDPYTLWICLMHDSEGSTVGALCGIDFGRDGQPWENPYRRVIEAELMLEHII